MIGFKFYKKLFIPTFLTVLLGILFLSFSHYVEAGGGGDGGGDGESPSRPMSRDDGLNSAAGRVANGGVATVGVESVANGIAGRATAMGVDNVSVSPNSSGGFDVRGTTVGGGGDNNISIPPEPPCIDGYQSFVVTVGAGRGERSETIYVECPQPDPVQCQRTNSCGQTNYGTMVNGSCSVSAPPESGCICNDSSASNAGQPLPCQYVALCTDAAADNYNNPAPCTYSCQDSNANNTGGSLPCTYDPDPPAGAPSCNFGAFSLPVAQGATYQVNSSAQNSGDDTIHKYVNGTRVQSWEYNGGGYWNPGVQTLTGTTRFHRDVWYTDSSGDTTSGSCSITITPQTTTTPDPDPVDPSCPANRLRNDGNCCRVGFQVTSNGALCESICSDPTWTYNPATTLCEPPTPTCVSNQGQVCRTSAANACGQQNYAYFQCNGSCPSVAPPSDAGCQCLNGSDDDGDGLTDHSGGDPGCYSPTDTSERDAAVSITVTPGLVRSGDEVEVSWNLGNNTANFCTVTGPDIGGTGDDSYEPTSATDRTGSATITATGQFVYTATCGTESDQAQVRLVPVIFET